jgi:hypothetical protein
MHANAYYKIGMVLAVIHLTITQNKDMVQKLIGYKNSVQKFMELEGKGMR